MNPSKIAINNPASIYLLVVMIAVVGWNAYQSLPREAAPDIQVPLLIVTIPFPGASPEDVESLVTRKAELKLQNVDNLKDLKSTSAEGIAQMTLEFELGFDVSDARTKVREKLDELQSDLPEDAEDPVITEINISEQPMLIVNMAGDVGLERLKEIAEDLKDDIEGIPGILEVNRSGGLDREVQVWVDPDKLRHFQITLNQISSTIEKENSNIPGGTIEMGPSKYLIRVPGQFDLPEEINDIVVDAPGQRPIFVRDVAQVEFGFKELTSHSRINGQESVSLSVSKRSGENLFALREQVGALVDVYQQRFQGRIAFRILNDQTVFVSQIQRDLDNNILSGFLFVFLVLLVVLGVRNALFVGTAIPLSFMLSMVVLQFLGFTLNFIVLFSLILALGMLVDNAIVVVENIYRHVQAGKPPKESALIGIREVALPVTTSTITTLAAFAPIIAMPGIVGDFMSYLPETLIITLSSSLFVALFISPVLCSTLLRRRVGAGETGDELEIAGRSWILRTYSQHLRFFLRFKWVFLPLVLVAFVGVLGIYGATTFQSRGVEFFPETEPEQATINVETPNGMRLDVTDAAVKRVEEVVAPYEGALESVVANSGTRRGFGGGGSGGSSSTSHLGYLELDFPDWQHWTTRPSQVIIALREAVKGITGAEVRVDKAQMGPPTGAPVNIEVAGQDFGEMLKVVDEIKRRIADVPGLVNLSDDFDRSRPEIRVIVDREKAARLGLRTQDIAFTVRTAFQGRKVSEYRPGNDEYDIVVRLDERFRGTPQDLSRLHLMTPAGAQVALSELARIDSAPSYGSIKHVDLKRVITVSGDAAEGQPGPEVLKRVQARLADYSPPPGITLAYTGANEDQQEAQGFLSQAFMIALFVIFIVLVMQFNSMATPFIIMSSVVLSLMGVFLALMIHDRPFSVIMSGIGTISLAGIVVNNAIVLIDFINQLRKRGYSRDEAVVLAGMVRLRPVLLTAITTMLGLLPVAMGLDLDFFRWPNVVILGGEGGAFWFPMAIVIIYGLAVSTMLTLIVVPMLYSAVEGTKEALGRLFRRGGGDGDASLSAAAD